MLTQQEIFSKAYANALTMKEMAKEPGDNGFCRYRAPNGERCLIGSFIPPERYNPNVEFHTITTHLLQEESEWGDFFREIGLAPYDPSSEEYFFLSNLQGCHDHAKSLEEMFRRLSEFARKYNLRIE